MLLNRHKLKLKILYIVIHLDFCLIQAFLFNSDANAIRRFQQQRVLKISFEFLMNVAMNPTHINADF